MTEVIEEEEVGLIVSPYIWSNEANALDNTLLLDTFCAHGFFCTYPQTPEDQRIIGASLLTNPANLVYGVWRGGNLVGVCILTEVVPGADATFHFLFTDGKLRSRRPVLHEFLGHCFRDLGFERISMRVPEFKPALIDFARLKLGFRFEGEVAAKLHQDVCKIAPPDQRPHVFVARFGSRKENAHYHDGRWQDVICLRLLKDEYEALAPKEV